MSQKRPVAAGGWSVPMEEPELRSLLNDAPIGIYRTGPDGRVLYLNQAGMRMLGYRAPGDELGRLGQDTYEPSYDRAEFRRRLEREGAIHGLESQWRRRDGSYLHVRENARAVRDAAGRVLYYEGTLEDVTELKEAEAQLRDLMRRAEFRAQLGRVLIERELEAPAIMDATARLLAESLGDACVVWRLSPDGGRLEAAASHHLDAGAARLLQETVRRAPQQADEGLLGSVLASGKPQRIEQVNAREARSALPAAFHEYLDEVGIQSLIVTPLRVRGKSAGLLALLRDVPGASYLPADVALVEDICDRVATALDRAELFASLTDELQRRAIAETEVRTLNIDLERRVQERTTQLSEAYRELESFSYTVSHDLRAPLRAIDGFTQALVDEQAHRLDDEGRELLARVRAAAQRMGRLIEALLDLSRVSRADLHHQRVDLSAVARDTIDALRRRDPGRTADVQIVPDLAVDADAPLARLVVENLLENAWKFTSRTPAARIEFGAETDEAGRRVFFVGDNGAGFPADRAETLFRPFQRLHSASDFPGTGIGLATVRRIVQRHGGRVWAEGAPGKGAMFRFTLGEPPQE